MNPCFATPPSQFTFFAGSGQFLYWFLTDPTTDLPILGSTITATLYAGRDINNPDVSPGTPVVNFDDLSFSSVPGCPGKYQCLITAAFNPTPGNGYVLVVDAVTSGYQDMDWSIPAIVAPGTVRVLIRDCVVSVSEFRRDLPEFGNVAAYPDSTICFWIAVANKFLVPERWCDLLFLGIEMFAAHMIVLEKQAMQTAAKGGWPGLSRGMINSEAAGSVSVGYDSVSAAEEGAGQWNLTVYGQRFYHMTQLFGAGPVQIGPGCGAPGTVPGSYNSPNEAWSGPPMLPSPSL